MDETTWQKAFNAGRAYQKICNAQVCMSLFFNEFPENSIAREEYEGFQLDLEDAKIFLRGEE